MSLKRAKNNSGSDYPDPSRFQQLVSESLSAIKTVQESMQHEASIVQEDRERVDAQFQEVEHNQARIVEIKNEVDMQRNEIAAKSSELESVRQSLQEQENDISARAMKLETEESQHASIRDTLVTLQDQINHDKEEIASQREELMERLGSTPKISPKKPATPEPVDVMETQEPEPEPEAPAVKKASPKSATGSDQFRKLRRDAKRKAIGA